MIKFITALTALIFTCYYGISQNPLTGRIIDFETNKPVKDVRISVEGKDIESVSNNYGYFQVKVDTTDFLVIEKPFYESGQVRAPFINGMRILIKKRTEPDYQGGFEEFYKFFYFNTIYPEKATSKRTHGKVYISFELDSLGHVDNIKMIKDIGNGCGEEIVRVLKSVPNQWIPTENSTTFILPVSFRIGNTVEKSIDGILPPGIILQEIVFTAIGIGVGK
jgi:hypothetical protein